MAETGEDIYNKIDKKKDLYIEENEILDFINNPKNGKENLNELGEYLTGNKNYPTGLKESIESLTDEEFKNTIGDKIKKGEKLSNYEVSLIYLNGSIKGQKFGKINFDQGLKEMCNGNLRRYIRSKYEKPEIYELINEEKSNIEKKLNKKYLEYNKNGYGEINLKSRQDQIKKSGDDVLKEVDEEITKKINELNEIARKNGYDLTHKNIKKIKDEEKKKVAKKIQSKYEEICTNRISDSKSTEIIKKISSRIDEYENLMNKGINDLINTINIKEYIGKGTENLSELGEELRLKENNKYPIWIEESIKCTVNGNFQKIIKNKLEKGENLTKDETILIYLYGSLNGQNFGKIDLNQGLEEICNGELLKYSILIFEVKPKNNEKKERDDKIKNIKDFIDKNHTGYIYKEDILNYINDKINGEKNLNNLGEYLKLYRDLEITYGEGSLIGGLRELFEFDYQFNEKIREKIKNNEEIDKKDIKIIYLQAQYEGKDLGKIELNKTPSQMCNGNLLKYIREKYKNQGYKGVLPSISGNTKRKGNEGYNPDKGKPLVTNVEELGNNTAKLPEIDDKETIYTRLKKIDKWAQSKYLAEYHEEKINSNKRHRNKTDQREKKEYIKYDLLKFALKKYSEEVNKEQLKIIEEAGYTKFGFEEDMRQLQKFYEEMKNRFPNINEIISEYNEIAEYDKECKERIFGGEEQYNQIGKKYGEYAKQVKEKEKQFEIEAIEEKIGKYSKMADNDGERIGFLLSKLTDEESLRYLLYHLEITKITGEYGDEIEKFKEYKLKMNEKYDNEKIKKTMDELQTFIEIINTHPGNLYINREEFQKYTKLKKENPELEKHLTNVNTITEALSNPASDDFNYILPIIHDDAIKKKMEQEIIDNERNELKENLPLIYYIKNFEAGFRNGLVDATIGVGTSLGVLLLNLRGDRDRVMASTKIKREMDNKFKVRQSSRQQDPIYSPETGFNITQDNLIASVGSSIANMLVLVYGGKEMGNIAKASGLEITEKAAFKQGLFQMGFFSQVGRSFEEAIQSNLEGKDALLYSILSAGVQGGLELVNPNEILLGQGSGIGKELITQLIAGKGNLFGKFLLKQVGKEIVQENLQEAMQLAAQNLMNQAWGGDLNVDWSRKNFAQTAIITTLTTGITTGISVGKQRLQLESSQPEIMARITSDQGLYEEVMGLIDKSIDGKFTIPNVKVEQLKDLRTTLEAIDAIQEQNNVESQNTESEKQENLEDNQEKEKTESQDNETSENSKNKKKKNKNYFNEKSHEYDVTEDQAIENSQYMDNLIEELKNGNKNTQLIEEILENINDGNLKEKLDNLRKRISEQYQKATGENLELTDEQLLGILDAHEQDGILGQLTRPQLAKKVRILALTITDNKVRRFLLEAGFCGKTESTLKTEQNIRRLQNVDKVTEEEINALIQMEIDLSNDHIVNIIGLCKSKNISFFYLAQFLNKSHNSNGILDTGETLERYNFVKNLIEQGKSLGQILKTIDNYDCIYSSRRLNQDQINKLLNYFKKKPIEDTNTVYMLIEKYMVEPDLVEKIIDIYSLHKREAINDIKVVEFLIQKYKEESTMMEKLSNIYSLQNIEQEFVSMIGKTEWTKRNETQKEFIEKLLKELQYNGNEITEFMKELNMDDKPSEIISKLEKILINDFINKYLEGTGLNNEEITRLKIYYIEGDKGIYELVKGLDFIKHYNKDPIKHIPDEIFEKEQIIDVLKQFGFVENEDGNFVGFNFYLAAEYKTLNSQIKDPKIYLKKEDIEKIRTMINKGNHKNFWKSLTPAELIHCYEQYKYILFETGSDLNLKYYGFNGEEMFEQMITLREKNILTQEEIKQLNDYAGNIFNADIERLKNILNKFTTNQQLKLSRREGNIKRFDEVVLSDGTKLVEIIQNFDKYANKIDEYNLELKGKVYSNERYLATKVQGNKVGFEGGSGIGWDVILEKGSHALFLPTYTDHHQSELEYLIRPDNNIVFQIEIDDFSKGPKIVGYVTTP